MHLVRFIFPRHRLILIATIYDPPNGINGRYTIIVVAQKTEISISADGDFGEMKKMETLSKRRRVDTGMSQHSPEFVHTWAFDITVWNSALLENDEYYVAENFTYMFR